MSEHKEDNRTTAESSVDLQRFVRHCLTCDAWNGNKQRTIRNIRKSGYIVMDWNDGCPNSGSCEESYQWAELDIYGNASVDIEVPANFGCVLYKNDNA